MLSLKFSTSRLLILQLELELDFEGVTPEGAPPKHGPVMALTRAMAAKLAAQSVAEDTPKKISKPCETLPSSRKLPTPRTSSSSYCEGCRKSRALDLNSSTVSNYSFNFSEFATLINVQFRELNFKIERIINRISSIEESVTDHGAIINDLERGISLIANRLDKISYHNDKVHKFTQTIHNSYSSLPLTKTPCSLNTQFRPTPTVSHTSRSTVSHSSVAPPKSAPRSHPPHAVTHRQSAHTSCSTIPSPTSTLPRHIAPLVPSSPRQYPSTQSTLTKDAPLFSDIVKAPPPRLNPAVPGVTVTRSNSVGKTVLIMGDSNTRHVHLFGEGVSEKRIPTYVVEGIDPHKCKGFDIVWLHVGVNSLKQRNCGDLRGVREKFDTFMSKIHKITEISPNTRLIVSPILPTAIPALNRRIVAFNRLLFSERAWWQELPLGDFIADNNLIASQFLSFNKERDKIHLGYRGIEKLTSLVKVAINFY